MQPESTRALEKLYNSYRDLLMAQKKLKHKSVLISSLEVKNNVRFRALSEAAISFVDTPYAAVEELLSGGYVREASEPSAYTITAKGILKVEERSKTLGAEDLISYIDSKYFDVFEASGGLTEKEKVIVMSLIAARAFSNTSTVDLYKDDTIDGWTSIVEKTHNKLREIGVVMKLERGDLFGVTASERPISNLLRHTDAIPRKTKGLYKAPGKQKYYLDVLVEGQLSRPNLSYLLRLVFSGGLDAASLHDIYDFCQRVAHDDGIRVFDIGTHTLADPSIDDEVMAAFRETLGHP